MRTETTTKSAVSETPSWIDKQRLGPWFLKGAAGIVFIFILSPLIFVIWLSFYSQHIPSFPPEGYTLKWYAAAIHQERFMSAFWLSIKVGVIATIIGLAVAVPAALGIANLRFRGRGLINNLMLTPLIVPSIVLGIALYLFQARIAIATGFPITGSLIGLIWGHVLLVIPWICHLVVANLSGFNHTLEEAAQSLGADRFTTFRRITLPLIMPGILAGALFGFVVSFRNLEVSLFLVAPGQTTLPISILQYLHWQIDPTIATVAVMQIVVIVVAMLISDYFVKFTRVM